MRRITFHVADDVLAEYALGGLATAARVEIEQHVEGCRQCTQKLAETADAFAVLADEVAPVAPAPALKDRLLGSLFGALEGGRA